ncbi:MAG TPA: hypothetical protein OIL86_15210 [Eggerthellaceae bacterium]|nr:hypothetical protein [Eggerthellaceae bacterium]
MTVRNAENVKRKGERLRFPKITIEYGNPLLVEDFDFLPKEDRLEGCTWYAMRECFALSLRVPREQVDMPALFPGGRDFTAVFEEHPVPRARHGRGRGVHPREARRQGGGFRRAGRGSAREGGARRVRRRLLRRAARARPGAQGPSRTGGGPTRWARSSTTRRWWHSWRNAACGPSTAWRTWRAPARWSSAAMA